MLLRPYGIVLDGELQLGLEIVLEGPVIREVRPHTGLPEPYVISPAFVNAHSHLEYRGLQGALNELDYWSWIRKITELKKSQTPEQVEADCLLAAQENRKTGVALIIEHSDRPYAAKALQQVGIGGFIFQELITFFEHDSPDEKWRIVQARAANQQAQYKLGRVAIGFHSAYTVDRATLERRGSSGAPNSIHVAETPYENDFFVDASGPIADFYRTNDVPFSSTGKSVVATLEDFRLTRRSVQFVHCCAVSGEDIAILARHDVPVCHCPRSNERLNCPPAPVREMLDAGLTVGLGLDSPASSGPIDMFAEMRAAVETAVKRGGPISAEEVWRMATCGGHETILHFYIEGMNEPWTICPESTTPLIKIHIPDALSTEDLIDRGSPSTVEWVAVSE